MKNRKHAQTLTWLSQVTGKKKIYIFYLVLLQALLGTMSVFSAILFRNLIDEAVAKEKAGFFHAVIWAAVLMAGRMMIGSLVRFLYEWSRAVLENQFKQRLFSCLLHKEYAAVTAIHSGEWMNRLTSDTAVVTNGIVDIVPSLTGMLTSADCYIYVRADVCVHSYSGRRSDSAAHLWFPQGAEASA